MDSSPNQPSQLEPVPVQLTRMEGTINLIAYQFAEVKDDVKEIRTVQGVHAKDIAELRLAQAQQTGASNSWKTWLPILAALAAVAVAAVALFR